jgi:hypothetical protein
MLTLAIATLTYVTGAASALTIAHSLRAAALAYVALMSERNRYD